MNIQSSNKIDEMEIVDEFPLVSATLSNFHNIPHSSIWSYLPLISQHLLNQNVYLSMYME
jgi:hypothetical protein